jgi:carboxypeptidase C (cathepsin A)
LVAQAAADPGNLRAAGEVWEVEGRRAGWARSLGNLTHAVVRNAGHMVPHDRPVEAKWLVQSWVEGVLARRGGGA